MPLSIVERGLSFDTEADKATSSDFGESELPRLAAAKETTEIPSTTTITPIRTVRASLLFLI